MSHLTIAYITSRKNPRIGWFFNSLKRQLTQSNSKELRIVVVSRHVLDVSAVDYGPYILSAFYTFPKPCVWQGPDRLTKEDWFAASNARNTALCHAPDGAIAYVDDLSVLMPGWMDAVQAAHVNYVVCGSYRKVKNLVVKNGEAVSYDNYPPGNDNRIAHAHQNPFPCAGNWLYGCSCAMPVEALLTVNGWDETCDGMGSEDYCTGIRMANAGYSFLYNKDMMTLESEEAHAEESPMKRTDKGRSPNDKSHALLNNALSSKWCPNFFGEGGIRALRDKILAGGTFPVMAIPEHDFYDGQPIREM